MASLAVPVSPEYREDDDPRSQEKVALDNDNNEFGKATSVMKEVEA